VFAFLLLVSFLFFFSLLVSFGTRVWLSFVRLLSLIKATHPRLVSSPFLSALTPSLLSLLTLVLRLLPSSSVHSLSSPCLGSASPFHFLSSTTLANFLTPSIFSVPTQQLLLPQSRF
jgi:hypothetical protein